MGLDPVTVTLTSFQKLETLRTELKIREEELQSVERDLRSAMRALAVHRYLKTVSPFYGTLPPPEEAATAPGLEKQRQALYAVIQTIRAGIPRLEAAVAVPAAASPRLEGRRNRFK
jgi:hypothetical protein